MKFTEDWNDRHPDVNDRVMRKRLRDVYPERQIWVGDSPELLLDNPVTPECAFSDLLVIGHETFRDRPILPSTVLSQVGADIAIYALGRSIKDPEDAAEYLLKRTQQPHVLGFLEGVFELVERAHDSGLHAKIFNTFIEGKAQHLIHVAFALHNRIDDSVTPVQFCNAVWQETIVLDVTTRVTS